MRLLVKKQTATTTTTTKLSKKIINLIGNNLKINEKKTKLIELSMKLIKQ